MAGPLDGVTILDLSTVIAGPMATSLLGDQGADVIKVETLGQGDVARYLGPMSGGISAMFATTNRNKRSIAIDLKDARGHAIVVDLARRADVVIQNFRPGAAKRLGLGYEDVRVLKSDIIYVSLSGFGQTGPYALRRVYDPVIQAISGFAEAQGDAKGNPALVQAIVCDKVTALTAAQAITAALLARKNGAGGQHVSLTMLDATLQFLWSDAFYNHTFLGGGATAAPDLASFYGVYRTKDGHVTIITLSDGEFKGLTRALGATALADDPRTQSVASRVKNATEIRAMVEPLVAAFTTQELSARLEAEDVPYAKVNRRSEIATDPQVVHCGTLVETQHPKAGPMREPRPAAQFSATPAALKRPAPMLGEHTGEILAAIGRSPAEIEQLRSAKVVG